MRKNIFIAVALLAMVVGCKNKNASVDKFELIQSKVDIKYDQSLVEDGDKIVFDSVMCSYVGDVSYDGDKFYFVDKKFCRIYEFDDNGKFLESKLGQGKSANEVDGGEITGFVKLNTGGSAVVSSVVCGVYDENYVKQNNLMLSFDNKEGEEPINPRIYTSAYEKFILKSCGDNIYYTVALAHPKFNFIDDVGGFYDCARSVLVVNYKTGEFVAMLGKYPEVYKNGGHNQFSLVNLDVNGKGDIYLSYEADKGIYVYDKDLKSTICFGVEGKDMNCSYPKLASLESFRDNYVDHRQRYSHYGDVEYIDELDYVSRVYVKDMPNEDGLHIYDNNHNLIADLSIPKGYKIAGSSQDGVVLYSIDELNEAITVLKLKL